ncbi:MAG: tol-pal system protein YbgF [Acidobacteriota bacterium]
MNPRGRGRRRRLVPWSACLLLSVALGGCTSLGGSQDSQSAEIARLQRENLELRRELTMRTVEEQRLRQRLADLEAGTGGVTPSAPATLPAAEPTAARESASQNADRPVDFGGAVDEVDLEPPPIQRAEAPANSIPGDSTPEGRAPTGSAPTGSEPTDSASAASPQQLYDEGYALFHQKRYAEAETAFRRFLELAPTSELADNALFWIGECRYARGDLVTALEAFGSVVDRYPSGNKVADAMLKAGKCLEQLGRVNDAIETYEEVGRLFPGSAASFTASERLDSLRAPGR